MKFNLIGFLTRALNHVNHIKNVAVDDPFDSDKKPFCEMILNSFSLYNILCIIVVSFLELKLYTLAVFKLKTGAKAS